MRRVTMVLVAAAVLLALFVPGALARTGCASSFSGDDRPNTLTGDRCDNEINGLGGDDIIRGNGGDDTLSGDRDGDRLSGGNGADELRGGQGRDRIYSGAFDGERDFVVCGAGRDFASIGEDDRVADDCEQVALAIECSARTHCIGPLLSGPRVAEGITIGLAGDQDPITATEEAPASGASSVAA